MKISVASAFGFAVSAIALGGCFPIRETYRPLISGRVVDESGAPVAAASVEACSNQSWGAMEGCPRRGTTTTAPDGKFEFKSVKEIDMCCFGEAPLPDTIVSVCMPDGRIGGAYIQGPTPVWVTVPVGPPDHLAPTKGGDMERRYGQSKAGVTARCTDPINGAKSSPNRSHE